MTVSGDHFRHHEKVMYKFTISLLYTLGVYIRPLITSLHIVDPVVISKKRLLVLFLLGGLNPSMLICEANSNDQFEHWWSQLTYHNRH